MPAMFADYSGPPLLPLAALFILGAAGVAVAVFLLRLLVFGSLKPLGSRLDRWRRSGVEPEREAALLSGNFLILAFVQGFARRYELPLAVLYPIACVWMMHLPRDLLNFLHNTGRAPAAIHRRGFFLFHAGPLRVRAILAFGALGLVAAGRALGADAGAALEPFLSLVEAIADFAP